MTQTLTAEQIDVMPAGREMDALVAERVMVLKVDYEFDDPRVPEFVDRYDEWGYLPEYSTDIAATWLVVEKLVDNCDMIDFFIECWSDGEWFVASHPMGYSSRKPQATCDGKITGKPSAPLAICRMALKTVIE